MASGKWRGFSNSSIRFIRRFHIEHIIILFFFPDPEIIAQVDPKTPGIAFPETARIYRTLLDGKIIFIRAKYIVAT